MNEVQQTPFMSLSLVPLADPNLSSKNAKNYFKLSKNYSVFLE